MHVLRSVLDDDLIDQLRPLVDAHGLEVTGRSVAVDWGRYRALDQTGTLRLFIAYDATMPLGYVCYLVGTSLHHADEVSAYHDALYVRPDRRRAGVGAALLRYSEAALRGEGVVYVHQHVPAGSPRLSVMLVREGYQPLESIYRKRIGG